MKRKMAEKADAKETPLNKVIFSFQSNRREGRPLYYPTFNETRLMEVSIGASFIRFPLRERIGTFFSRSLFEKKHANAGGAARVIALVVFAILGTGVVFGEVPNRRWAAVAAYGGAGIRYTATPKVNVESRVLFGEGIALSARGAMQWNRPEWKVTPLAGLEMSVIAPFQGKGEHGQAISLFFGGEVPISRRWTVQVDLGPALLRIQGENSKEYDWDYQNVLNLSLNYYFGKAVR